MYIYEYICNVITFNGKTYHEFEKSKKGHIIGVRGGKGGEK